MDNRILEVDGVENNSCVGRDGGGEPPSFSECGKEFVVVVSDLLTAAFPKKDSRTCC